MTLWTTSCFESRLLRSLWTFNSVYVSPCMWQVKYPYMYCSMWECLTYFPSFHPLVHIINHTALTQCLAWFHQTKDIYWLEFKEAIQDTFIKIKRYIKIPYSYLFIFKDTVLNIFIQVRWSWWNNTSLHYIHVKYTCMCLGAEQTQNFIPF